MLPESHSTKCGFTGKLVRSDLSVIYVIMSDRLKESFGESNLKYLGYWTGMFLFYRFFLATTLVTLIALLAMLVISVQLVKQITRTIDEYNETNQLRAERLVV